MTMLQIPGAIALSDFRKKKIVHQLAAALPGCIGVEAHFLHFVDVSEQQPLTPSQIQTLEKLLDYGQGVGRPTDQKGALSIGRVSVPRIGTISPWATKATDIAWHCGLNTIKRVERGIQWALIFDQSEIDESAMNAVLSGSIYDPMVESCLLHADEAEVLFSKASPAPLCIIDILGGGMLALEAANTEFGFALSDPEKAYLLEQYTLLGRNPTDVELMMFAQVNSEHCRHKIFNADWTVDGEAKAKSLFGMIRTTHQKNSEGTLVAYNDNAAILQGSAASKLLVDHTDGQFRYVEEPAHIAIKVETHNHPTAISPFPGASTGSGGEIRDEGATGRGGKPKAGLAGFTVSHLRLPDLPRPWESEAKTPGRIASPLQIMLEGPIGAAAFNNEFGRPNIAGYFRTFEMASETPEKRYGYHKPIMLAGGLGNVRPSHVNKNAITSGAPIVVLGGPTMLIGLGGGAASSVASGSSSESLDFASVQRGNPEMQRRCQEVIDSCVALGDKNPIMSIHDVGAGGICNALPELVHDAGKGGAFELRSVLNDEPGMSPMQIWCNESQERYVMAIHPDQFDTFKAICARERCLFAEVGHATDTQELKLTDAHFGNRDGAVDPIDLSMDLLFGLPPKMQRNVESAAITLTDFSRSDVDPSEAIERVLSFPAVADKTFLVTIGDRSVTGLIARDQMVGPWQVPVADVAVTNSGYQGFAGEAMSLGERTPTALLNGPASGRMAIGEALTNIAAAKITDLSAVRLSANWMVAAGESGHDASLYRTVEAVAMDLCPALGVAIPVGKDSMSMSTRWSDEKGNLNSVVSPLSLVVTAFAPVSDTRLTCTPQICSNSGETELWCIDLGEGKNRLGGSVLCQVYDSMGTEPPDVNAGLLKGFMTAMAKMLDQNLLLAYHDRSDGGWAATLCEMAFAGRVGLDVDLSKLGTDALSTLFSEELGAVIQVRQADHEKIYSIFSAAGLGMVVHPVGTPVKGDQIVIRHQDQTLIEKARTDLHRRWSEVTWKMQSLRDNPACADQEYARITDLADPGIQALLSFDPAVNVAETFINTSNRPKVAILREQGVNGQLEMAAAFDRAGFDAIDVTMSDLVGGGDLSGYAGFAACGGFSFGDVLGAGEGWAKSILFNSQLRDTFEQFFQRPDTFALGVCNGCQMMSTIKSLIPGAEHWPKFVRNQSEQYEARFVTVSIESEKSILMQGMKGSSFAVSTAHGEGRAWFAESNQLESLNAAGQVTMRYVDNHHAVTERYPLNPNGSPEGVTGFTNADGRFTIMMPHPERVARTVSNSWHPGDWPDDSPWMRLFQNARKWVG